MKKLTDSARAVRRDSEPGQRWLVRRAIAAAVGVLVLLGIYARLELQRTPKGPDPVVRSISENAAPARATEAPAPPPASEPARDAKPAGTETTAAAPVPPVPEAPAAVPVTTALVPAAPAALVAAADVNAGAKAGLPAAGGATADAARLEQALNNAREQAEKARVEREQTEQALSQRRAADKPSSDKLRQESANKTERSGAKADIAPRDTAKARKAEEAPAKHADTAPLARAEEAASPDRATFGAGTLLEATTVRPPADADRLRERLVSNGFAPRSDTRINMGPFGSGAEAREVLDRMESLGYIGAIVGEGRVVSLGGYSRPDDARGALLAAGRLGFPAVAATVFTVGPFGSALEADNAQERLQAVGLQTQRIEPVVRTPKAQRGRSAPSRNAGGVRDGAKARGQQSVGLAQTTTRA